VFLKKLLDKFTGGNTLYYPGCLTRYALPEAAERYEKILAQLGVDFIKLPDFEFCCGMPVLNAGYVKDFEKLKEKNLDVFRRHGVGKIITNCPACYKMFSDYGLETEHVIQTIHARLDKISVKHDGDVTYHDPCHLGRHCGIYDEPREILRHVGFTVKEFKLCREHARCCGGGAGLKTNYPELAGDIARERLAEVETKKLVTPCPLCYAHFKENAKNVEVLEFSEVLV